MGELIKAFTVGRNALKRNPDESADAVLSSLEKVEAGVDLSALKRDDNGSYNVIRDLITYCGVIRRESESASVTPLGEQFKGLCSRNKGDAWQWLITRSLWLYVVPNGTASKVNTVARELGVGVNFFRTTVGLLVLASSLPQEERVVTYYEICKLLDDDVNWSNSPQEVFRKLLELRNDGGGIQGADRGLLGDLEDEFGVGRDNLNTCFNKAFQQTGLFEYRKIGSRFVGIAIKASLGKVLSRRIRAVLDISPVWLDGDDWTQYLQPKSSDLPLEVSDENQALISAEAEAEDGLEGLLSSLTKSLNTAGVRFEQELLLRFSASLLSKRFLILTGLAGSGKTKIAQSFARWITPRVEIKDPFMPGARVESSRITYYVRRSDQLSVEFSNKEDGEEATIVALPRALIREWADYIALNGIEEGTSARDIREAVKLESEYSDQLQSFETHLKAAAFALLKAEVEEDRERRYAIVPVGADWTASDSVLGYPDGLDARRYVKREGLSLIMRAKERPELPHFLILDEMNLSHVERYFAEFLSAIESGEAIPLYKAIRDEDGSALVRDGVPETVVLPKNLFVIGTVNVDETTYMFSPKVLDRANVIEFRVNEVAMSQFLNEPKVVDLKKLDGVGRGFGPAFVRTAVGGFESLEDPDELKFRSLMELYHRLLSKHGAEFGFRVALEAERFIKASVLLGAQHVWTCDGDEGTLNWLDFAMDAVIVQKFLPKLHGSRTKLGPLLKTLWHHCVTPHDLSGADKDERLRKIEAEVKNAQGAARSAEKKSEPSLPIEGIESVVPYPLSADKIGRMWRLLRDNGFTSFAEA